jgi:hypothetical protein
MQRKDIVTQKSQELNFKALIRESNMDKDIFKKRLDELDELSAAIDQKLELSDEIRENNPDKASQLTIEALQELQTVYKGTIKVIEDWNEWAEKSGQPVF